jgi:hypothetical protein
MSKSSKDKEHDLLAMAFHQIGEQKNHQIHAAIEALVFWTEMVSTTKRRIFQV